MAAAPNLSTIRKAGEGLSAFPEDVLHGKSADGVTELVLSNNEIRAIPATISKLRLLTLIRLDNNMLTVVPPEVGLLAQLRVLDLKSNFIQSLPIQLGACARLELLNLLDNPLKGAAPPDGEHTFATLYYGTTQPVNVDVENPSPLIRAATARTLGVLRRFLEADAPPPTPSLSPIRELDSSPSRPAQSSAASRNGQGSGVLRKSEAIARLSRALAAADAAKLRSAVAAAKAAGVSGPQVDTAAAAADCLDELTQAIYSDDVQSIKTAMAAWEKLLLPSKPHGQAYLAARHRLTQVVQRDAKPWRAALSSADAVKLQQQREAERAARIQAERQMQERKAHGERIFKQWKQEKEEAKAREQQYLHGFLRWQHDMARYAAERAAYEEEQNLERERAWPTRIVAPPATPTFNVRLRAAQAVSTSRPGSPMSSPSGSPARSAAAPERFVLPRPPPRLFPPAYPRRPFTSPSQQRGSAWGSLGSPPGTASSATSSKATSPQPPSRGSSSQAHRANMLRAGLPASGTARIDVFTPTSKPSSPASTSGRSPHARVMQARTMVAAAAAPLDAPKSESAGAPQRSTPPVNDGTDHADAADVDIQEDLDSASTVVAESFHGQAVQPAAASEVEDEEREAPLPPDYAPPPPVARPKAPMRQDLAAAAPGASNRGNDIDARPHTSYHASRGHGAEAAAGGIPPAINFGDLGPVAEVPSPLEGDCDDEFISRSSSSVENEPLFIESGAPDIPAIPPASPGAVIADDELLAMQSLRILGTPEERDTTSSLEEEEELDGPVGDTGPSGAPPAVPCTPAADGQDSEPSEEENYQEDAFEKEQQTLQAQAADDQDSIQDEAPVGSDVAQDAVSALDPGVRGVQGLEEELVQSAEPDLVDQVSYELDEPKELAPRDLIEVEAAANENTARDAGAKDASIVDEVTGAKPLGTALHDSADSDQAVPEPEATVMSDGANKDLTPSEGDKAPAHHEPATEEAIGAEMPVAKEIAGLTAVKEEQMPAAEVPAADEVTHAELQAGAISDTAATADEAKPASEVGSEPEGDDALEATAKVAEAAAVEEVHTPAVDAPADDEAIGAELSAAAIGDTAATADEAKPASEVGSEPEGDDALEATAKAAEAAAVEEVHTPAVDAPAADETIGAELSAAAIGDTTATADEAKPASEVGSEPEGDDALEATAKAAEAAAVEEVHTPAVDAPAADETIGAELSAAALDDTAATAAEVGSAPEGEAAPEATAKAAEAAAVEEAQTPAEEAPAADETIGAELSAAALDDTAATAAEVGSTPAGEAAPEATAKAAEAGALEEAQTPAEEAPAADETIGAELSAAALDDTAATADEVGSAPEGEAAPEATAKAAEAGALEEAQTPAEEAPAADETIGAELSAAAIGDTAATAAEVGSAPEGEAAPEATAKAAEAGALEEAQTPAVDAPAADETIGAELSAAALDDTAATAAEVGTSPEGEAAPEATAKAAEAGAVEEAQKPASKAPAADSDDASAPQGTTSPAEAVAGEEEQTPSADAPASVETVSAEAPATSGLGHAAAYQNEYSDETASQPALAATSVETATPEVIAPTGGSKAGADDTLAAEGPQVAEPLADAMDERAGADQAVSACHEVEAAAIKGTAVPRREIAVVKEEQTVAEGVNVTRQGPGAELPDKHSTEDDKVVGATKAGPAAALVDTTVTGESVVENMPADRDAFDAKEAVAVDGDATKAEEPASAEEAAEVAALSVAAQDMAAEAPVAASNASLVANHVEMVDEAALQSASPEVQHEASKPKASEGTAEEVDVEPHTEAEADVKGNLDDPAVHPDNSETAADIAVDIPVQLAANDGITDADTDQVSGPSPRSGSVLGEPEPAADAVIAVPAPEAVDATHAGEKDNMHGPADTTLAVPLEAHPDPLRTEEVADPSSTAVEAGEEAAAIATEAQGVRASTSADGSENQVPTNPVAKQLTGDSVTAHSETDARHDDGVAKAEAPLKAAQAADVEELAAVAEVTEAAAAHDDPILEEVDGRPASDVPVANTHAATLKDQAADDAAEEVEPSARHAEAASASPAAAADAQETDTQHPASMPEEAPTAGAEDGDSPEPASPSELADVAAPGQTAEAGHESGADGTGDAAAAAGEEATGIAPASGEVGDSAANPLLGPSDAPPDLNHEPNVKNTADQVIAEAEAPKEEAPAGEATQADTAAVQPAADATKGEHEATSTSDGAKHAAERAVEDKAANSPSDTPDQALVSVPSPGQAAETAQPTDAGEPEAVHGTTQADETVKEETGPDTPGGTHPQTDAPEHVQSSPAEATPASDDLSEPQVVDAPAGEDASVYPEADVGDGSRDGASVSEAPAAAAAAAVVPETDEAAPKEAADDAEETSSGQDMTVSSPSTVVPSERVEPVAASAEVVTGDVVLIDDEAAAAVRASPVAPRPQGVVDTQQHDRLSGAAAAPHDLNNAPHQKASEVAAAAGGPDALGTDISDDQGSIDPHHATQPAAKEAAASSSPEHAVLKPDAGATELEDGDAAAPEVVAEPDRESAVAPKPATKHDAPADGPMPGAAVTAIKGAGGEKTPGAEAEGNGLALTGGNLASLPRTAEDISPRTATEAAEEKSKSEHTAPAAPATIKGEATKA